MIKALNRIGVTSLLAVIALATPVLAQEAVDGAFSITLPEGFGEFAKQTQKSSAPEGGEIETTNWVSKSPAGEAVVVTQSTMPGRILDPAKMIESTRDSLLKTLNAELESEEPIEGEAPSARLRFRSNGAVFRSRFVVDENRFYQILFVGRSDEGRNAPAVDELFRSFSIVTPPPADPAQVSSN